MANTENLEKDHPTPTARDVFEGLKGRPPKTDRELDEWLASDEGKAAMVFESATALRYGEVGRS
jgi:hypothetical protein